MLFIFLINYASSLAVVISATCCGAYLVLKAALAIL